MAWVLERDFYPGHLEVANLLTHRRKVQGLWVEEPGRVVTCLVCDVTSDNTRTRRSDARFVRAHRRCWRHYGSGA